MRESRLINNAISNFNLDLRGLTVLTEAASGHYVWTPIIAALSGAEVIAYSRDSRFATFDEVKRLTLEYAELLDVLTRITVTDILDSSHISKADIITNLGFLRPLNKDKLRNCKETAVITLMWETWEFRERDLDLRYCIESHIPVLGTNESHPLLRTIDYLGCVAKKMLFECNVEVFQTKIGIIGSGRFAKTILRSLNLDEADCFSITSFSESEIREIPYCDALIVADHESDIVYIGKNGLLTAEKLKEINRDVKLFHICGGIEIEELKKNGIVTFPLDIAPSRSMSVRTDYVGPKPLVDLHTAGLKVGEELSRARLSGLDYDASISKTLNNQIAQDFSKGQRERNGYHK